MDCFELKDQEEQLFAQITPRQEQALLLLASGYSQSCVASELGVNRRTLYSWMNDDQIFHQCYEIVREQLYSRNMERVGSIASLALERLPQLIQSDDEKVSLEAVKFALHAGGLTYR